MCDRLTVTDSAGSGRDRSTDRPVGGGTGYGMMITASEARTDYCKWKLYFQTGGKEVRGLTESTGEPLEKCFQWYLDTFGITELTVAELFQVSQLARPRTFPDMSRPISSRLR